MLRLLLAAVSVAFAQTPPDRAFAILEARCLACHNASLAQSGLDLHTRDAALKGGHRGPALVPGNAAQSRLLQAIQRTGALAMPPGPKLPANEIAALEQWINAGATYPQAANQTNPAANWWSFRSPKKAEPPTKAVPPIDAFIQAKLAANGLKPAKEADRATLIRRATLDLHGLPPTAEQVAAFVADPDPAAYEKLIDRLLASPRYGEKWGRHWLDLVRYGDTGGFEQDPYLLYAWRYRDWVVDSLNNDKPYDRFVKEQLASDELYPDDPIAMTGGGYYTVGTNRDMLYKVEDINRQETLQDWVDTTGSVFLGLSVGCARCHDHKFDPISQREYHALQAIFVNAEKSRVFLQYDPARGYDLADNGRQVRLYEIAEQLQTILPPAGQKKEYTDEENKRLEAIKQQLVNMFRNYKPGPFAPNIRDLHREAPKVFLPARPGRAPEEVKPALLSALGGGPIPEPPLDSISTRRRTALANWIASKDHPLTSRVMVNRVWQYHFGTGLVATPSDFGRRGAPPTHPELLDWLAVDFMEQGWSLKKLHKAIMTSAAYRQSVEASPEANAKDATNAYLSHFNRRRLLPEEIRDGMLQSSGALNLDMGGRPVIPEIAREELFGLSNNSFWLTTADTKQHTRRSLYLLNRRTFRPAMFENFDAPDGIQSCSRRAESNTAPQSLTLLNGLWTTQEATRLGARIAAASNDAERIHQAWRAIYARPAAADEVRTAQAFLERQTKELGTVEKACSELVRALFNTNEFLYVD